MISPTIMGDQLLIEQCNDNPEELKNPERVGVALNGSYYIPS